MLRSTGNEQFFDIPPKWGGVLGSEVVRGFRVLKLSIVAPETVKFWSQSVKIIVIHLSPVFRKKC